jgi:membrane protein
VKARLQRLAQSVQGWLPVRVVMAFGASQASNYASALAFNALLAMFPLILGILAIVGLAIRDPATEAKVEALLIQSFPGSSTQYDVLQALHGVKQAAGWFGLVSIAGFVWSASGIFGSMEFVFAEIFGIRQRDIVRQKLMGFVMMIVLVAALALTVGANSLAAFLPGSWLISIAIGSVLMMSLLTALYRLVPNRSYQLRDILPGALLAGILIEVLSLAWPLYERISNGFSTYGREFALFFLLAAWFYLLSNLILLGAVFNRFRLGDPMKDGLIATPQQQARRVQRPVEAIRQRKRAEDSSRPASPPSDEEATEEEGDRVQRASSRKPPAQSAAGYVLVGLALLLRRGRRRGSHSIET